MLINIHTHYFDFKDLVINDFRIVISMSLKRIAISY